MDDKIPGYCTHYAGVGCVIVNNKGEVLIVKEKGGLRKGKWGLAGGVVDSNELLEEAMIRECKEELGIDCKFIKLLGFRELSKFKGNRNDLYFLG